MFNSQTKNSNFAALLIGFSTALSGLLGLLRDRLLASRLGAGPSLDIYFAAFPIPDLIYGLLVLGGISIAFLPLFAEAAKNKKAWHFANNVLNCFLLLFVLLAAALFLLTPLLINWVTPGFKAQEKSQAIVLTRIMFLSPILLGTSAIFSGILQHFQKFFAFALAPLFYNLGIIAGILFFLPHLGLPGLAWGVVLGALLHLLVQTLPARASGFYYLPLFNFRSPGLKKLFSLMGPGLAAQAVLQFNLIFITALASILAAGSIGIFNLANNLRTYPISIIGLAWALAFFPLLSRSEAGGQKERFKKEFSLAFRQILFLIIPLSVLFFLLRAQIARLVWGGGRWGWWETRLGAASLGLFSLGIFAGALIPLLSRAFFSLKDTKTPLLVAVASVALNIALSLSFVFALFFKNPFSQFLINFLKLEGVDDVQVIALPLALSLSQIGQFSLLSAFLGKKIAPFNWGEIYFSLKKILLASLIMAPLTYSSLRISARLVNMETFWGVLEQTFAAGSLGILVYGALAFFLKSPELKTLLESLRESMLKLK